MNYKRILGIIAILAGIGLYFYCKDGQSRVQHARKQVDSADAFIPDNPVTDPLKDIAKSDAYRRIDQYKEPIRLCFIGSGILVVGGFILLIFGTTMKKKK